jgi:DNA-binding protein H-NS
MKVNLKGMSEKELKKLQSDVETALANLAESKRADAKKAAEAAASKFGFSLSDFVSTPAKKRKPVAAKYRNPADKSQTWSGRGRQPIWYKDAIAAGKSPEDLAI